MKTESAAFCLSTPPWKWKVAVEEWRRANTLRQRSDLAEVHSGRWQSHCFESEETALLERDRVPG